MMAFGISVIGILIAGIIIGITLILLLLYFTKKRPSAEKLPEISVPVSLVSKSPAKTDGIETPAAQAVEIRVSQGGLSVIESKITELSMFLHEKTVEEGQIIEFQGVSLKIETVTPSSPAEVTALTEINIALV